MTRPHTAAVSVLLPVRNGMPHLRRAVESILGQTQQDLELLVIDDGSTDDTASYLRGLSDPRLRILSTGGRGLAAALNLGLRSAVAPFVARQDADDWSAPERLSEQLQWLAGRPDIDVLSTTTAFVDAEGRPLENAWTRTVRAQWDTAVAPDAIAALMPLTCCLFHATVVARTQVLRRAGGYDPAMVPAEDYDLWLRLLPTARFGRLVAPLYTVRVHAGSSSALRRAHQIDRVITAKLAYLRRTVSGLPSRPALALPCADRGARLVAPIARRERFRVKTLGPTTPTALLTRTRKRPDVVMVTDFSVLEAWREALTSAGAYEAVGNLFVKRDGRRRAERGAKPARTSDEPKPAAHPF